MTIAQTTLPLTLLVLALTLPVGQGLCPGQDRIMMISQTSTEMQIKRGVVQRTRWMAINTLPPRPSPQRAETQNSKEILQQVLHSKQIRILTHIYLLLGRVVLHHHSRGNWVSDSAGCCVNNAKRTSRANQGRKR